MDRHRSSNPPREEARSRPSIKNKQNPIADAVFLIQNQNDVLRMKNAELNAKIKELQLQLQLYTQSIVLQEKQIENTKNIIASTTYKEDIEIENEKKLLTEKLILLKTSEEMLTRKIKEAREATIFEEEKVAGIQNDRKGIQMEIISLRAQNEGTKIILENLENENERLREENESLVNRRKVHEPKQKQVSLEIEERIRIIKHQQQNLQNIRRYQTSKLLNSILSILYHNKMKQNLAKVLRYSLIKKFSSKKIVQLSLIRKKYTFFIKQQALEIFKSKFRPLEEQEITKKIIAATHNRRVKNNIWRKWRTATKNAQFMTTRRFQFQNVLQKIQEAITKTNIYATFNLLKFFRNNPFHQDAVLTINHIWTNFMNRSKTHFLSSLKTAAKKYELQQEIEVSSKEQSQLLVLSLYFTAWGKVAKSHGIQNKNIKRRYFKQLKKLLALKNRRKLGQMLTETNYKISQVDTMAKVFTQMKKEAALQRLQSLQEERIQYETKKKSMKDQLHELHTGRKELYQELALLKVSKYLKKKVQKAFDIWRLRKQQSKVILTIMNMVESKKTFDKNFGFAKILQKRFAMLKKSINDKIQSCQFSYNYLLDQNKHIKDVLDTKTHELEKTKFMNILKNICRNEKEMKLKYFYKFMRSGYRFWKFRKTCVRIDKMAERKIKVVFMWLLKQNNKQIQDEHKLERYLHHKESLFATIAYKKCLKGFQMNRERCKRLKRVLGGVFERNLELDFYVAFGKIRNEEHIYYRGLIQADINEIQGQISTIDAGAAEQQNKIQILTNRLKDKEKIFAERKLLTLYQFFVKNIKSRYGSYLQRWNKRVQREKNVLKFAQTLERKSRIMLKNKFMLSINKKNQDYTLTELQEKLEKFQNQYNKLASNQEKFLQENEKQSARMKAEVEVFNKEGQALEKHTDFMTNLKIKSFKASWNKKIIKFCFREWKQQFRIFVDKWTSVDYKLALRVKSQTFTYFVKEMKQVLLKRKHRLNLLRIYTKKYKINLGYGFKIWKEVYHDYKIQQKANQLRQQKKKYDGLQKIYKYAVNRHNGQVDYRQFDTKIRKTWNFWRQFSQKGAANKIKEKKLSTWLVRGINSQFIRLLKKKVNRKIAFKQKLQKFTRKWQQLRMKAFLEYTSQNKYRRKSVERLFVNKFSPFMIHKLQENFFMMCKNYGFSQQALARDDKTLKIQHVIEVFEKRRKGILNTYMIKWRRNGYEINISKKLMRRVTRNAMNWRVKDLFYTWKLECEAKKVKQMHEEEGEVKKRIKQINRLKIFLEDFKKQKGLLLQDEAGSYVLSPRYQDKKDQQVKKDNNLRYRFISRLILSMNGYSAPAKAWNNFKMYMLLRQKYKKYAKFTRNSLRKPQLYYAFRIWHKASSEFTKMFDTMQRKGLIKILNKQKDKMEMEYSKKLSLQQKIKEEMKVHKLLSYHEDRKQKLCAFLLLKNVRKIKLYSLLAWKDRIREMKEHELNELEDQGNSKINELEEEVNDLQEEQRQLKENNMKLEQAVREALDIAQMVKRITQERDLLSKLLLQKQLTCESLQEQNEQLNAKLYQAQKQAMNLLILSGQRL